MFSINILEQFTALADFPIAIDIVEEAKKKDLLFFMVYLVS